MIPELVKAKPLCKGRMDESLEEFTLNGSGHLSGARVRIRRYCPHDREVVRRICCDTGFLGEPIDSIFHDRELYADLLTLPYLDYESNRTFVADVENQVVGYLLGSTRPDFDRIMVRTGFRTFCKMLFRLFTHQYTGHQRTKQFIRWMLFSGLSERPKHPNNAAHLHFDLERKFRGRGIGQRMWKLYEAELRSAGIPRCYGEFYSSGTRQPERAYSRVGFRIYDRRRTTLFHPEIPEPLYIVCVDKRLQS